MFKLFILLIILNLHLFKGLTQEIAYGSNHGKSITLYGTKVYYEEYGSGVPLLLLHGGFGSIHDFQLVVPELANHFKVIAVDSPGHGRSEQTDTLSFELMSNYISEMIDLLKFDSVYIIGYSDGGITALLLAAQRPEKVKKVIASGANSRMDGLQSEVLGYLSLLSPEFIEANQKEWLKDYQSKTPEKDNWEKYITDMKKMYSKEVLITKQILSNISAKVLLVYGDKDLIKLEHGLELYHTIHGSKFCVIPNTPHEVFSNEPELVNKIALRFLKD